MSSRKILSRTPFQYAVTQQKIGKFPHIRIEKTAGMIYMTDEDGNMLKSKHYSSVEAAEKDRTKILMRAGKRVNKQ